MQKIKTKFRFISLFLGFICLCSCNSDKKGGGNGETGNMGQLVLVFEDSATNRFFQQRKAVFQYLDDNQLPVEIPVNPDQQGTNILINADREYIDLVYRDNSQLEFTYFLQNNDSVLVQEKGKKPWLTSSKGKNSTYNANLELLRNTELYGKAYSKAQDFYFLWNETKEFPFELGMNEDLKQIKDEAIQGFQRELGWIDSLANAGLITEEIKTFYASKNRLEQKKLEAYDPDSMVFNTQMAVNSFLEKTETYPDYSVYLDGFSELIIAGQTRTQSKALIDSLMGGGSLGFREKSLLYHYLQKEIPNLSFEEADEVLERYGDKLANPAQLASLSSPNDSLRHQKPDMELMGLGNSYGTFEELLSQKRGKYLYVDLWAAWCIPCIKAFPASLALNVEYEDKGVEVVFLSVDDNYKFWEEVAEKYDIAIPGQSFVAIKKDESEYLRALDVALIPRYLIFDPDGKLIHPNAPRPDSGEIRDLLGNLIGP